ncbi:MAG: hypothetical protein EB084_08270 [Proteobacteria bacterium]|nr:hypothetical protein [Pseudomonadota bacterium]
MSLSDDRSMVRDRLGGAVRRALDGVSSPGAVSKAYARWIRRRERSLHDATKDRASLPFEWGVEHLGLGGVAELDALVRRAQERSDTLFSAGPRFEGPYTFDGALLRFPSAVTSRYPVNDTVVGRVFRGRSRHAVIVIPEWTASWQSHVTFCRLLVRCGFTALLVSAPYHHARQPSCVARPEYLCSANIGRTLAAVRQGVLDVRRAADWLEMQGVERIAVTGTSAGSLIGFLAFVHDTRLQKGTFVMLAASFADVVWRGMATEHVRAALSGHVTLEQLRHLWSPLSPLSHVDRLVDDSRSMLFVSGTYDPTCLPDLTRPLYEALRQRGLRHREMWLPCGHHTMATFPFNVIATAQVLAFLSGLGG